MGSLSPFPFRAQRPLLLASAHYLTDQPHHATLPPSVASCGRKGRKSKRPTVTWGESSSCGPSAPRGGLPDSAADEQILPAYCQERRTWGHGLPEDCGGSGRSLVGHWIYRGRRLRSVASPETGSRPVWIGHLLGLPLNEGEGGGSNSGHVEHERRFLPPWGVAVGSPHARLETRERHAYEESRPCREVLTQVGSWRGPLASAFPTKIRSWWPRRDFGANRRGSKLCQSGIPRTWYEDDLAEIDAWTVKTTS
jgi:hypothetical protein